MSPLMLQVAQLDARGWALVHSAPREALVFLTEAVHLARATQDSSGLSTALRHTAFAYYGLGDFPAALETAREAVHIARDLGDSFLIAAAVNIQGIAHRYRGELSEALEAQLEHLRLAQELHQDLMCAHALSNIGSIYLDLGENHRAQAYHTSAAELARALGEDGTWLKARNNLATGLQHLGQFQEAATIFEDTLGLARRLAYRGEEALALNGLARAALDRGQAQAAHDFAGQALEVAQLTSDRGMMAEAQLSIGRALLGLGEAAAALVTLSAALDTARTAHIHRLCAEVLHSLTTAHETQGQLSQALGTLRQAHELDLKVHAELAARRTNALSALVEVERFRLAAEHERTRATELAAANRALQDARFRQDELTLKLAHQASHDALTGLPNRTLLNDRLTQALSSAQTLGLHLGVLFIDLDDFKVVNDSLGHSAGDALLCEVARRLDQAFSKECTAARLGGDEFCVIAPHLTTQESLKQVVQTVLNALKSPYQIAGHELRVGVSVGVSLSPADGADAATLLRHADLAMYQAKRAGKNDVRYFAAPLLVSEAQERAEKEAHLRARQSDPDSA